jgi:hypothetical protein
LDLSNLVDDPFLALGACDGFESGLCKSGTRRSSGPNQQDDDFGQRHLRPDFSGKARG